MVPDAGMMPTPRMVAGTRGTPGMMVTPAARMMTPTAGAVAAAVMTSVTAVAAAGVMTSVTAVVPGAATSMPGVGQNRGCARDNTGDGHG